MEALAPPLDRRAIESILPHRPPFLFVDRITELEPDRRIVGVKNVSYDERYLVRAEGARPSLPATILMEAVAQVGAVMILAKPENRRRVVFFMGVARARFRLPVHAGDTVVIEARALRTGPRMGLFEGTARVGGRVVAEGAMSFALGPEDQA
jgi:3-hydroxyacyl-[acyl-carrier-protein] dehydratase